jgi:predicted RNA methylase
VAQFVHYEKQRLALQKELDCRKTQTERNRLGQFATPTALARDILEYGTRLLPDNEPIRFLDPAIGTGSFYSALQKTAAANRLEEATGFEIDEHFGEPTKSLWSNTPLNIHIDDFTTTKTPKIEEAKYNLLICNPPYVRHHHIIGSQKSRLLHNVMQACGIRFDGLSGLYCYFMGISHAWMRDGGIAGWLVPSEFMDVNYGEALKYYLLNRVKLLRIHRFDPNDVQFRDALVSSAVVFFCKEKPPADNKIEFTFGGTLAKPGMSRLVSAKTLQHEKKWTRFPVRDAREPVNGITLSALFTIKRGLATGDNKFFILTREQIKRNELPMKFFKPILPSPRYLPLDEIPADADGNPSIDRLLFLLDCDLPEEQLRIEYPSLWKYYESGKPRVAGRYLCRTRTPWYSQEKRPPSQFICTYMGRGNIKRNRPFRFILNHSKATVANVYLLLYPKPFLASELSRDTKLARRIWILLNQIHMDMFFEEGRVYGGGLYKMEPRELANLPAEHLSDFIPESLRSVPKQLKLFSDEIS